MEKKKWTQEELDSATETLYSYFDLPEGVTVREIHPCALKGSVSFDTVNGKLYLTKNLVAFIGKRAFGGAATRIWSVEEILDLEAVRKHSIKIVATSMKATVLTNFEDVEEGRDRCLKSIKRVFFGISGNTVLQMAVENMEYDKVRQILDRDVSQLNVLNQQKQNALIIACQKNDINMINLLLEYYEKTNDKEKADINMATAQGDHVLHWACKISNIEDQILLNLIKFKGINVDAKNVDNTTPLHYLMMNTHSLNCARIGHEMIEIGADPNAITSQGETPLHKAMFNTKVRTFLVKMLLEHGARVDVPGGQRGDTPLHYAVRLFRKDLVEALLATGADCRIKNNDGRDCLMLAVEIDALQSTPQTSQIVEVLGNVTRLTEILQRCDLLDLTKRFIAEGLHDPNVLAQVNEAALNSLNFDIKLGPKVKLLKEIENLNNSIAAEKEREEAEKNRREAEKRKQEAEAALSGKGAHQMETGQIRNELDLGDGRWEISADDLEYVAKLGQGASGQVFKGLFKQQEVAIKVLTASDIEAELAEFKKEFQILTAINSPYTIKFYGASIEPQLCMVMELCEKGSLYDLLHKESLSLDWPMALHFMRDMAEGVTVLHENDPPIIHRDLKSLNLLVTKDNKVKLCDFGLSRAKQGDMKTFNRLCGTFAYCAPEVFNGDRATEKSDVFSMGIVIWELMKVVLNHKYEMPYAEYGLTYDFQIIVQSSQGLRPSVPDGAPLDLVKLYQALIDPVPANRPDARSVVEELKRMQEEVRIDRQGWASRVYRAPAKSEPSKAALAQSAPAAPSAEKKSGFSGWGKKEDAGPASSPAPVSAPVPVSEKRSGFAGWGKKEEAKPPESPKSGFQGWGALQDDDSKKTQRTHSNKPKK